MTDAVTNPKNSIMQTIRNIIGKFLLMLLNIIALPPLVMLILFSLVLAFLIKTKNLIEDTLE